MTPEHWSRISSDPVSSQVQQAVKRTLAARRRGFIPCYEAYLEWAIRGLRVLDVGAVEHDWSHINSAEWKHRRLKTWAGYLVGIDILAEKAAVLSQSGFDIRCVDATSDSDLGERFDVVVIGDVIEHVDDPVALLRFARRHMTLEGRIIVKTPNPYWWRFIWRNYREGTLVANAEHLRWVSPSMALEMGHRAGLDLAGYLYLGSSQKTRALAWILDKLGDTAEMVSYDFVYEFALA